MRPLARFCLLGSPLILLIFVLGGEGLFSEVKGGERSNQHTALRLSTSNKYAAGPLEGLDNGSNFKVISSKLFPDLLSAARQHPRKRKMTDVTKDPQSNTLQTLINTWTDGSFSPVHKHERYSEVS